MGQAGLRLGFQAMRQRAVESDGAPDRVASDIQDQVAAAAQDAQPDARLDAAPGQGAASDSAVVQVTHPAASR